MNKLIAYFRESWEELKKVTWPTKRQTLNYSLAVVALSIILALVIGALDFGFNLGIQYILEHKPASPSVTAPATNTTTSQPIQINPSDIKVETTPVNAPKK